MGGGVSYTLRNFHADADSHAGASQRLQLLQIAPRALQISRSRSSPSCLPLTRTAACQAAFPGHPRLHEREGVGLRNAHHSSHFSARFPDAA